MNPDIWSRVEKSHFLFNVQKYKILIFDAKLIFYSAKQKYDSFCSCSSWSPGALGLSKYGNSEVGLLCFAMYESKQCWIYDDSKKKMRKFPVKTNHGHLHARVGNYQGQGSWLIFYKVHKLCNIMQYRGGQDITAWRLVIGWKTLECDTLLCKIQY